MGKGDKKSKKGKRWRNSYGNARSRAAIKERMKRVTNGPKAVVDVAVAVETVEAKPKAKRTVKKKTEAAE